MSNIFLRSVLLKMQATKKQAFLTKNYLPFALHVSLFHHYTSIFPSAAPLLGKHLSQ